MLVPLRLATPFNLLPILTSALVPAPAAALSQLLHPDQQPRLLVDLNTPTVTSGGTFVFLPALPDGRLVIG